MAFRGRLADWPAFVGAFMERHAITAVLMHSEQRPYHHEAAAEARRRGIDVIVTELGYLRPDWMTIEKYGNSVDSLFPTDPDTIRALAAGVPDVDTAVRYPREAGLETVDDLKTNLANVFLWFTYPHYRQHGLYHPFVAYARFLWREGQLSRRNAAARAVRDRLAAPFFLFAMQTDTDFQIRTNSQYADTTEALTEVFASFAAHAPAGTRLVVKKHPGDLGPVHWAERVPQLAAAAGIAGRVAFVDGLPMSEWTHDAAGLVTINSSAGLDGLAAGIPTITLSPAIYDVPGLTAQQPLDAFWTAPQVPDPALFAAYRKALAASIQVRGTIYSRAGTRAAAEAMANRILTGTVNAPDPADRTPPRYARAGALGIRPR
ncbi:capsular biosynthesis protein [Acuticoccus sediminis]|uniref:Capsular biosynthesis protein n=1 Tax=Acuticoccus sediminis TaxID=2184697 RepID=A0A8B2NU63_9HYPH|nr:capsular biosynthesis protein [Acuticoccus sediminis]RAI03738.1 capsular biosynthesis protein [Acuticoccus sediminis]